MDIQATLKTAEYRGDHSADVSIACAVKEGETVDELCGRLLVMRHGKPGVDIFTDVIELRVVKEAGGVPK